MAMAISVHNTGASEFGTRFSYASSSMEFRIGVKCYWHMEQSPTSVGLGSCAPAPNELWLCTYMNCLAQLVMKVQSK